MPILLIEPVFALVLALVFAFACCLTSWGRVHVCVRVWVCHYSLSHK